MILDGFDDLSDLKNKYAIYDEDLNDCNVIFALYECGSYDGSSMVVFEKGSKLYLVEAGHCSCYGLEGQWSPVEVTKESLLKEADAKEGWGDYEKFVKWVRETYE